MRTEVVVMRYAMLVGFAVLASCTTEPDPRVEAARNYIKEVTGDDLKAGGGGLRVSVRSAVADGRYVRISGTVENRFDERVEGIRYTALLMAPGSPPRVVETFRKEVDTTLDPSDRKLMHIEIENPIHASAPGLFTVEAHPVRLGDREVPPPPDWQ